MISNEDRGRSHDDPQSHFLRLFLSAEPELLKFVAALVPNCADAEEIVQQTTMSLWKNLDQYDARPPFAPWACRFAIKIIKQWIAGRDRWRSLLERGVVDEFASRRDQRRTQMERRLRHLDQCLEKLPTEHRGVVEAYYFRRQTVDMIASETRRSVDAVYKILQRIRLALRECIELATQAGETCP